MQRMFAGVLCAVVLVCMVLLSVARLGIFKPAMEDIRLAAADLRAFLRHRPEG